MTFDIHYFTGGDNEGLWALPDILVNVRRSGEDIVIGVVREVLPVSFFFPFCRNDSIIIAFLSFSIEINSLA